MAKLYFRYGAMNSGKSTGLLQAAFNYEERGQRVLLAKPDVDTKGDTDVVSRLGMTRSVDFLIPAGASARELFTAQAHGDDPDALLEHVDTRRWPACWWTRPSSWNRSRWTTCSASRSWTTSPCSPTASAPTSGPARSPVAVGCWRSRTPSKSSRPSAAAAARPSSTPAGSGTQVVFDGDQVAIDGQDVWYESLCGACYLEVSGGRLGS